MTHRQTTMIFRQLFDSVSGTFGNNGDSNQDLTGGPAEKLIVPIIGRASHGWRFPVQSRKSVAFSAWLLAEAPEDARQLRRLKSKPRASGFTSLFW